MRLKVSHGVGRQESEGDPRIESCAIQDGDMMSDVGLGCIVCTKTQKQHDFCLDGREQGVLGLFLEWEGKNHD